MMSKHFTMPLLPFLKKYFWEIKFEDLDKERSYYIIERILEYGDIEAVKWVLKNYPREEIIKVLRTSRALSKGNYNILHLIISVGYAYPTLIALQPLPALKNHLF